MQSFAVFVALIAAASATVVYRVPSQDSAVISSQRYGGNFAYNVAEGHSYGVQTPVYQYVASPVATTYSQAGLVQNVQVKSGQQLTYAQAVPSYSQLGYTVPATSVVAAGTPAHTYKTYAGVSPINYGSLYNGVYNGVYGYAV